MFQTKQKCVFNKEFNISVQELQLIDLQYIS